MTVSGLTRMAAAIWAAALLQGCTTVPEKPNFTLQLKGNYQAIADCAIVEFQQMDSAWWKTDYPTMSKSELIFGAPGTVVAGRILISASGPGTTTVESRVQQAVWGKDFWERKHRPIFEKCSG